LLVEERAHCLRQLLILEEALGLVGGEHRLQQHRELEDLELVVALERLDVSDRQAVRHEVDLTVQDGDFILVLGGNGAGKSSLIKTIAGQLPVEQGQILIQDKDFTHVPEYKRARFVSHVFQNPALNVCVELTLFENLCFALCRAKCRGLRLGTRSAYIARFRDALATFHLGLEDKLDVPMKSFSGGQRQAVGLLMATLEKPSILLLDEHTSALDPKTGQLIMSLTQTYVQTHQITTLMVTHNLDHFHQFGNRALFMQNGKILHDLNAEQKRKTHRSELLSYFQY